MRSTTATTRYADKIARAYTGVGLFPKGYQQRQFNAVQATGILAFYDPSKHTLTSS